MDKDSKKLVLIATAVFAVLVVLAGYVFTLWMPAAEETPMADSIKNTQQAQNISYHPEISLQAFSQKEFDGRGLELGPVLDDNPSYTRYYITYKSGDLVISGIMNVPKGEGPFPVLILSHGYIDPAVYTNGRGLKREQDHFARNGYVVIHPDYRGHADSTDAENEDENFRLGYAEDVINAVYAVRSSELGFFDKENIGMLGHSMGGGIALTVMATHPDLVKAFSLYAPVSADTRDNFDQWTRERSETAQKILAEHGDFQENPDFWDNISPINFIDKVQAPVILHHGTADASCDIEWSERFAQEMEDEGKDITFHVYENAPHEFIGNWQIFMQRNVDFFDANLKQE